MTKPSSIASLDGAEMVELWLTASWPKPAGWGELFVLGLHPERVHPCATALEATLDAARALSPGVGRPAGRDRGLVVGTGAGDRPLALM